MAAPLFSFLTKTRSLISRTLILLLVISTVSCSLSPSDDELFRAIWGGPVSENLEIVRVLGSLSEGFAVFAKLPRFEFEKFKKETTFYTSWNQLEDGMSFEIDGVELHSPSDISGFYSVGEKVGSFVKVIVWDERTETVVVMLASGIM